MKTGISLRMLLVWLGAGVIAGAQTAPVVLDFADPVLREWVQPEYPAEAKKTKAEGRVSVEFVVEPDGSVSHEKVSRSTDEQFNAATLAAVRQWKFGPALEEGKPAASGMEVVVGFELAQLGQKQKPLYPPVHLMPRPLPLEPSEARSSLDPAYPAELETRRLPGEVVIEFTVDPEGRAREPKVLMASHPAFVESALRTLEQGKFTPAHQGAVPKRSRMQYPVAFESDGATSTDVLLANQLEITSGEPTVLPRVLVLAQPVYPRDRLLAGEKGLAAAEFTINAEGRTEDIREISANAPEFAAALTAAIESWVFKPAQGAEGPMAVRVKAGHTFATEETGAEARLAARLRPDGDGVGTASGLDQKLKPLWRGFPVYPQALLGQRITGSAEVEFVIDRDGRARVPRIVKASEETFGWAAAMAISQWVFERPTRQGEPVDVTVRIPVAFKPPQ